MFTTGSNKNLSDDEWEQVEATPASASNEEKPETSASLFAGSLAIAQNYFSDDYIKKLLIEATHETCLKRQISREASAQASSSNNASVKSVEISSVHLSGTRCFFMPRLPQAFYQAWEEQLISCSSFMSRLCL